MRLFRHSKSAISTLAALTLLAAACGPTATPSPTTAPAKPAAQPTTAAAKPADSKPAAGATTAPAAKAAASPAAKAAASPASKPAASPAASPATSADSANAALYEAAKAEGKVVYYSSDESSETELIREAFGKRYPGITVEGQEGRGRDTREKVIAEQAAGRVIADIVIAGGNTMSELIEAGHLVQYQSPEVEHLLPAIADKRGYVNPRVVNVYGITVNTNVVPPQDEPKAWKDLLDPKYSGKMSAQDPRGSGGGMYILTGLLELYGEEFLQNLAKQKIFFGSSNSQLVTDIVRGEHGLLLTGSAGQIVPARQEGAPIKMIKPEEGVVLIPIGMAMVKNAPHPNAAKLFIDWMLSEEGQKVVADMGETPARRGVKAAEPETDLTDVKVLELRYDGSDREETAELSKKWDALFFKQN